MPTMPKGQCTCKGGNQLANKKNQEISAQPVSNSRRMSASKENPKSITPTKAPSNQEALGCTCPKPLTQGFPGPRGARSPSTDSRSRSTQRESPKVEPIFRSASQQSSGSGRVMITDILSPMQSLNNGNHVSRENNSGRSPSQSSRSGSQSSRPKEPISAAPPLEAPESPPPEAPVESSPDGCTCCCDPPQDTKAEIEPEAVCESCAAFEKPPTPPPEPEPEVVPEPEPEPEPEPPKPKKKSGGFCQQLQFQIFQQDGGSDNQNDENNTAPNNGEGDVGHADGDNNSGGHKLWQKFTLDIIQTKSEGDDHNEQQNESQGGGWLQQLRLHIYQEKSGDSAETPEPEPEPEKEPEPVVNNECCPE